MREVFQAELREVQDRLVEIATLVSVSIENATRAFNESNVSLAETVIADDEKIDVAALELDELAIQILARQQPVARDLRIISAALKMITDMERIADQASDIGEILSMPLHGPALPFPPHLKQMAQETARMVHKAIDAYVARDKQLAREVMKDDDIVDDLFHQVKIDIIDMMREIACNGANYDSMQLLDMLMIAKYFERSADHAVNIAEWVEYAVSGIYKGDRLQ